MATVTINEFGLQAGTTSTVYVTWSWTKENTEHYQVKWYYYTGDNTWFLGNDSTVGYDDGEGDRQSSYGAPTNAKKVKVIIKPVSKKHTVNDVETSYWTADWSTAKTYSFSDNPPVKPEVPNVVIEKYKLTATIDNLDVNATGIEFQVVKDDKTVFSTGKATISTSNATYSCNVDAGGEYKVRCRSYEGSEYSEWSNYSGNVSTMPAASSGITTIRAASTTSVYLEWGESKVAKSYDIQYTTKKEYFDGSDKVTTINGVEYPHYEKTGLESGEEYFFRVRAVNEKGSSAWSEPKSVIIGKAPAAPTTWSSTTKAVVGEPLTLYWAHNTQDGSRQTYAYIELYVNDSPYPESYTINDVENDDNEDVDDVTHFAVDTSDWPEGTKIRWRVQTAGVTKTYGDWSIMRTIDIYAPATLALNVTDKEGESIDTLEAFPCYIRGEAGPDSQTPIGYHVSIVSNDVYETIDRMGNSKIVNKGELVYSKHFDISEDLVVELSAGNIDLENNISYTVTCVVSMDSGLTAEASDIFTVAWTDMELEPNAEIGIDKETYSASIRPYCVNEYGSPIEGVSLAVYRREFDGSFTELATGLSNSDNVFITDPHPALDFARYRIVAISDATGAVGYYDLPPYPVGGNAAIIQWNEEWTQFDTSNEDVFEQPVWSGSMLKLLYNVDISDSHKPDVEHISYIGREHPVTYYGTQLGETSNWKMDIPADDVETLYAIRRLARWMGDVYVREPSGSGYWASINVSYSKNHCNLTIPITLSITRVEGGI